MTKDVIVVTAVSTPEQAKDDKESMEAQERDLLAVAAQEGWNVIDIIRIPGFSRRYFTLRELVDAASAEGEFGPAQLERHIQRGDFDGMLVRATNRFGREQSLNAEIIGKVIQLCRAFIYSQMDGLITGQNFRPITAITGYRDSAEVDEFIRKRQTGIVGLAKRGLPVHGRPLLPYRLMRDDKGKAQRLELRKDLVPLWNDLATLLLEGVPYDHLEIELFDRFGHGENGKAYAYRRFYRVILNATFWGNSAIHWLSKTNGAREYGAWIFDPSESPPEGVEIYYGTHAPVYTGETAELIKAEIRRRAIDTNGKSRRGLQHPFAGLVVCDECGYRFAYARSYIKRYGTTYHYMRCNNIGLTAHYQSPCRNKKHIREEAVRAFMEEQIDFWLESGKVVIERPQQHDTDRQIADLRAATATLERRKNAIMHELSLADDDLKADFRAQLRTLKDEQSRAEAQLDTLERQTNRYAAEAYGQDAALKFIASIGLPAFWQLDALTVNRWLHSLLGAWRIAVYNGEVVAFTDRVLHTLKGR